MSENTQEKEEVVPPEPTEVEIQAMEFGWRPEAEFKADPNNEGKKWRTADDFMDRKSLFDKIDSYSHQVKDLRKGIDALTEHNRKIEKTSYDRALADLRKEKRAALEDGDLVKADQIDERIDEIKETKQAAPAQNPGPTPEYQAWIAQNQWYVTNNKMQAYADGLALQMQQRGASPQEIFATVEREVREQFPQQFRNPRKDSAPNLDVSDKKSQGKKAAVDQLTADERKIMNTMLRAGVKLSEEEYAKQVLSSRGVS